MHKLLLEMERTITNKLCTCVQVFRFISSKREFLWALKIRRICNGKKMLCPQSFNFASFIHSGLRTKVYGVRTKGHNIPYKVQPPYPTPTP